MWFFINKFIIRIIIKYVYIKEYYNQIESGKCISSICNKNSSILPGTNYLGSGLDSKLEH